MKIKSILITMVMTLIIVISVIALPTTTSTINLDQDKINKLKALNITKISINQYECNNAYCFKLDGDLNESLTNLPTKICDEPNKKDVWINQTRIIKSCFNGKCKDVIRRVPIKIKRWDGTTKCHNITNDEVNFYVDRLANYKINEKIKAKDNSVTQIKYGERIILNEKI